MYTFLDCFLTSDLWDNMIRFVLYLPHLRIESKTENAFKLPVKMDANGFPTLPIHLQNPIPRAGAQSYWIWYDKRITEHQTLSMIYSAEICHDLRHQFFYNFTLLFIVSGYMKVFLWQNIWMLQPSHRCFRKNPEISFEKVSKQCWQKACYSMNTCNTNVSKIMF